MRYLFEEFVLSVRSRLVMGIKNEDRLCLCRATEGERRLMKQGLMRKRREEDL